MEITDLSPELLWKHFYALTQIPRPSKHESEAVEFIRDFGQAIGLETNVDKAGNVIIKKTATKGMENKKRVVLQGHLDMVPQKNNDTQHDFETDPINAYVEGEWVTAKGTTLGADNGMGVAAAMAVLEADNLEHGPIEALFTVDEESGMTGAFALEKDALESDILINMDSEDEGQLFVGCAGGINANISMEYPLANPPQGFAGVKVTIKGLKGGHSGLDINLGRANANILLTRLLFEASKQMDLKMSSFHGGGMRNAIPREATAVVSVPESKLSEFYSLIDTYRDVFQFEYKDVEPGLSVVTENVDSPKDVLQEEIKDDIFKAIYGSPNGVIRMSTAMKDLVETSTNLATVTIEQGNISVLCLLRSAVDSAKDDLANRIQCVFELAGAKVEFSGSYPGWKPNPDSSILKTMQTTYKKLYGKDPEIAAIHAGLECGIIGGKYPNLDMISFGPTIRFPHSPDEKVHVESVKKFWDFLVETLKNVDDK
jgi:dipeptidase D